MRCLGYVESVRFRLPSPIVRLLNPWVVALCRSPLHWLVSSHIAVLTVFGRKTGQPYTFPVSYLQSGDRLRCFTQFGWWKNVQDGRPAVVLLRRRRLQCVAEVVRDDHPAIQRGLDELLRAIPSDAPYYGVSLRRGLPDSDHLERAARKTVLVHFSIAEGFVDRQPAGCRRQEA